MTVYSEGERFSLGNVDAEISRVVFETFTVRFELNRVDKEISEFTCSTRGSRGITAVDYEE